MILIIDKQSLECINGTPLHAFSDISLRLSFLQWLIVISSLLLDNPEAGRI